jgi:hypothetical protein
MNGLFLSEGQKKELPSAVLFELEQVAIITNS